MSGQVPEAGDRVVRRRHVLMLGGFDPRTPSWMHSTHVKHAALQGRVTGATYAVGNRERLPDGDMAWDVRGVTADGDVCDARVEVVSWDGLIKKEWTTGGLMLMLHGIVSYAVAFTLGFRRMVRVGRLSPLSLTIFLFPLGLFLATLLALCGLAAVAAWATHRLVGVVAVDVAVALAVVVGGLWLAGRLVEMTQVGLLIRSFSFIIRYARRGMPAFEAIIARGARRLVALSNDPDIDEVLVIGHSMGGILATKVVASALPAIAQDRDGLPEIALLTLGAELPMVNVSPGVDRYAQELTALAKSPILRWIDVAAPADWAAFPLLDPLALCGVSLADRGNGAPTMTSPRFHTMFSPESYAALVAVKYDLHMQYIRSTEKPGLYDYFAITAGPCTLRARYAGVAGAPPRP
jgi:hypothetical protein